MAKVVMYMTSTAATLKLKSDIRRMKELLEAKKVIYEEVRRRVVQGEGLCFTLHLFYLLRFGSDPCR